MARITGTVYSCSELKNAGNFYWLILKIDDTRNPKKLSRPSLQITGWRNETSENFKLINLAQSLVKGELVILDYELEAYVTEKNPEPAFTNNVIWQIHRTNSSTILPQEPDPVPAAQPTPAETRVDFSKPVETALEGDLPDFVKPSSDTDEKF